jgi:hypothetical protein
MFMNTKKFLVGGLTGGIIYFLLGYLFYGNLFSDFFMKHAGTATGVSRAMDQFVWWSLVLGNILGGCLLSYVFVKSNVKSVGSGLVTGAVMLPHTILFRMVPLILLPLQGYSVILVFSH